MVIHFIVADAYFSEYYDEGAKEPRGVMSSSLLSSALGEPKQTFNGKDLYSDIYQKAAALMRSLVQNHCFHDGNKRTAMMTTIIFLEDNGYEVIAPKKKMYRLAMKIVKEKPTPTVNNIARTLKKYSKPRSYKQERRFIPAFLRHILKKKP